jgi:hypothetical protein
MQGLRPRKPPDFDACGAYSIEVVFGSRKPPDFDACGAYS